MQDSTQHSTLSTDYDFFPPPALFHFLHWVHHFARSLPRTVKPVKVVKKHLRPGLLGRFQEAALARDQGWWTSPGATCRLWGWLL